MVESSSSSSSSESRAKKAKKDKKVKKDKKSKKAKKKDKKDKKAKKQQKAAEKKDKHTEAWVFDRDEALRLTSQLLSLEVGIEDGLMSVFETLDVGDEVRLDGLQNKTAKKKLRHLLKAFRLAEDDGAFKSVSKKVSFSSIFRRCVEDARRNDKSSAPKPAFAAEAAAASVSSKAAAAKYGAQSAPAPAPAAADAAAGEDDDMGEDGPPVAAPPPEPAGPRKVGPQLPGASVGPGVEEEEPSSDDDDVGAGPKAAGEEREGVDLNSMPRQHSARESWMTETHGALAGAFQDGPSKADKFAIQRSKKEQEAFEKLYKERGASLLQQQAEGAFEGHEEAQDKMRKRKHTGTDLWGLTANAQAHAGAGGSDRHEFDPEKDMQSKRAMAGEDFSKIVENSISGLAGRFGRGGVATSFL